MSGRARSSTVQAQHSFLSDASSPEQAVARESESEIDDERETPYVDDSLDETESDSSTIRQRMPDSPMTVFLADSYRRPNPIGAGSRAIAAAADPIRSRHPTKAERREAREEEWSLLTENHIIPPLRPVKAETVWQWCCRKVRRRRDSSAPQALDSGPRDSGERERRDADMAETAPLLGNANGPDSGQDAPADIDKQWEEAVRRGDIRTTWQREAKVLLRYSAPLVLTFLLQYSLNVASVFTVGHIGKIELGAVTLASMTANITGFAVYQGLATSLDTLCAQAYGSGQKTLVGLHMQKMVGRPLHAEIPNLTASDQVYFLGCITIPIGILWLSAERILLKMVPEPQIAVLAGRYLRVILIGAPAYACFESGKRYLQAQGLFSASLYVLLICAPLNVFMNWLFVWVWLPGAANLSACDAVRSDPPANDQ